MRCRDANGLHCFVNQVLADVGRVGGANRAQLEILVPRQLFLLAQLDVVVLLGILARAMARQFKGHVAKVLDAIRPNVKNSGVCQVNKSYRFRFLCHTGYRSWRQELRLPCRNSLAYCPPVIDPPRYER